MKRYFTLNEFLRRKYNKKVIKILLNLGLTCPNRDGTLSHDGCIFCGEKGSGDFSESAALDLKTQFELYKHKLKNKSEDVYYIAYFQAFTNTYGDINYLERKYSEAAELDNVVAVSIATRPDCIDKPILNVIKSLSQKTSVFVELGFQTSNPDSTRLINRCYDNEIYDKAVYELGKIGVDVVTHVILGLPFETTKDILNTVKYISSRNLNGVKLQLLHVLKNTRLAQMYYDNVFEMLTFNEYIDIVASCLELLPKSIVIHRLTGDAPKHLLIAPSFSTDKKRILNAVDKEMIVRNSWQGKFFA